MSYHYTTADIRRIRELATEMTAKEVADMMGRTIGAIQQVAFRNNIKFGPGHYRCHTMKDVNEVVRLRRSGLTFRQVAEQSGIKLTSCMYLYRRHG